MIKILTVIGARPQIIKAAALSRAINNNFKDKIHEKIIHTGQHYDINMSQIFIDELNIPSPDFNLSAGSGLHGEQTSKMIAGIENILISEKPDAIILFGDTNSTLAGAIAASKLHIPVVHIEAGLRSYNKSMPEEINRLLCDHISTLLCCPTEQSLLNLYREGFNKNASAPFSIDNPLVIKTGDIMLDNSLYFSNISDEKSNITNKLNINKDEFILVTIHRPDNTDNTHRLNSIFNALIKISETFQLPLIIPLHPRTKKMMNHILKNEIVNNLKKNYYIRIISPVSFLDMIKLEKNCKLIITDSGGVQKEAFFYGKPSIILRTETEWTEIVESGTAVITDVDINKIFNGTATFLKNSNTLTFPDFYGKGDAALNICNLICDLFNK